MSIISSAAVAIGVKGMELRDKRNDRQHQQGLELTKRTWEAKRDALQSIINSSSRIRDRCRRPGSGKGTPEEQLRRKRIDIVITLAEERKALDDRGGRGALIAWAEQPARGSIEELLDIIDAELHLHRGVLESLDVLDPLAPKQEDLDVIIKGPNHVAIRKEHFEALKAVGEAKTELRNKIGTLSKMDLRALSDQCDKVIELAVEDLRGRYGPNPAD